jgi:hypothetical protein
MNFIVAAFAVICLLSIKVNAEVPSCQIEGKAFSKDLDSNPFFDPNRAVANYQNLCQKIFSAPGPWNSDDIIVGQQDAFKEAEMGENCRSLGADSLLDVQRLFTPKEIQQIKTLQERARALNTPYISNDPTVIAKNKIYYQLASDISKLRIADLKPLNYDSLKGAKIKTHKWNLIYADFVVTDIELSVGQCRMRWDGLSNKPRLDIK